jgi:hypothetical protein
MGTTRIGAIVHTAKLDSRIRRAERHERQALARIGELVAVAAERGANGDPRIHQATANQARTLRLELDAITRAMGDSLAADQADYVAVSAWIRPLVIARGLCARAVLRHDRRRCRQRLRPLYESLGAAALAARPGEPSMLGLIGVPAPLTEAARNAAAVHRSAAAERAAHLAPYHGSALPAWCCGLASESKVLVKTLGKQLHEKLLPRVSALAGLATGWWIANTYTDSHWRSAFRSLGIGRGGTHVVSSETFQAMSFWLPVLAAALCAYLGNRLSILIRRRYRPPASS